MPQKNHTSIENLIQKRLYVGSMAKESLPPVANTEKAPLQEVVEHENIDQEVKPHVEVRPEKVEVPEELKKIGVQPVSNPQFTVFTDVKIPLDDEKVVTGLHAPIYSSLRWLALLCIYILQKGHVSLKKVHGKVTRITKR